MEYVDAETLLRDAHRKQRRAKEAVSRARAKLGVQTATRSEAYVDKSSPLAWLFADSSPEDVIKDSRTLKKILHIFKTHPRLRRSSGRSIIQLSNGRSCASIRGPAR